MATCWFAMEELAAHNPGFQPVPVFACDIKPASKAFVLMKHFPGVTFYDDVFGDAIKNVPYRASSHSNGMMSAITFEARLPRGAWDRERMRSLQEILRAPGSHGWWQLQGYSSLSDTAATTADIISWVHVRKRILQGAIHPARHDDHQLPARGQSAASQVLQSASSQATFEFGLDHWQAVVRTSGVEMVHGLHSYLRRWQDEDDQVRVWCEEGANRELAEVGGWLADYMHTILFFVAAGREQPESAYRVVDNTTYMGLALLLLPQSMHKRRER